MDKETVMLVELISKGEKPTQLTAFLLLLEKSETRVNWSYEVWEKLLLDLQSSNVYQRVGASQLLCYLSISDPEQRILHSFQDIWECTYEPDEELAESVLRATWRIGLAGEQQKTILLQAYEERFRGLCGSDHKLDQTICWTILDNLENLNSQMPDESTQNLLDKLKR